MSILLTGGAGYIGSHTVVEFSHAGWDVVIADNFSNSHPEVLKRLKAITGKDIPFYLLDVARDKEGLCRLFCEQNIEGVIHFAGLKAVGESVAKPLQYYRNNLDSTLTLLEVMEKYGVNRLVFSSSATVYGAAEQVPLVEDMATGCTNPYGYTKWMSEQILKDMAAAVPDLSVVLLRYFNPVGAHESGLIGEAPNGIPNNLMPYISQVAAGKLDKLRVFGADYDTPDGTGVRDYIHVTDLAKGHLAAWNYAMRHKGAEIFNLGTGKGCSVLELVQAFSLENGIELPYEITDRRPGDVAVCYADPTKAYKVLGWKAEKSIKDMCRDAWRWQRQNPEGYQREME